MDIQKASDQIFTINKIVGPVCLVVFVIILFLGYKNTTVSIFVVVFALLTFLDGILSLRFQKPSLKEGLKRLCESDISDEEEIKKESIIKGWQRLFTVCSIAGPIFLLLFWFLLFNT